MFYMLYIESGIFSGEKLMENQKALMRKSMLELRQSMSPEEVTLKSRIIMERLCELEQFKAAAFVMSYVDFRNEVETKPFIRKCLNMGKRVAVPAVVKDQSGRRIMIAAEISDMDMELEPGTFGVLEPKKDLLKEVDPLVLDLVVVPGVIFSLQRHRIGYGAAFYDRFLGKLRKDCLKAGVCFDMQVMDYIPAEEHDIPVDVVITENRMI